MKTKANTLKMAGLKYRKGLDFDGIIAQLAGLIPATSHLRTPGFVRKKNLYFFNPLLGLLLFAAEYAENFTSSGHIIRGTGIAI